MSDILDENGLSLQTLTEIIDQLEIDLKAIYGDDINIDADSPDGQAINIFAQAAIDLRELIQSIYSSMDPAQASGVVLDQRVALNGIKRNAGTFSVVPVVVTVDRSVSLVGLDDDSTTLDIPAGVYTVKDDAGTQWVLLNSATIAAGAHSLSFRARDIGAVEATVGTITTPVTVIAGVVSVNNVSGVSTQGVDEETDTQLRIRRERSLSNVASGYLDAIEGNLLDVEGVTEAVVYENSTDTTDADGIPPHSIWAIVEGGADADIANVLYAKKTAGAGFKGSEVVDVERTYGRTFEVKFDRSVDEDLYVQFSISLPGGIIDTAAMAADIVENIQWQLGGDAVGSTITAYLMGLNSKYQISAMGLSKDGITYLEIVSPTSKAGRFVMATARISIT